MTAAHNHPTPTSRSCRPRRWRFPIFRWMIFWLSGTTISMNGPITTIGSGWKVAWPTGCKTCVWWFETVTAQKLEEVGETGILPSNCAAIANAYLPTVPSSRHLTT